MPTPEETLAALTAALANSPEAALAAPAITGTPSVVDQYLQNVLTGQYALQGLDDFNNALRNHDYTALASTFAPLAQTARIPANALAHALAPENALLSTENTVENALMKQPIRAYHGSPYDFDAFDLSKIGTGEGAQAYGHGLYMAENPEVAQSYKETLSKGRGHWEYNGERIPVDFGTPWKNMGEQEYIKQQLEGSKQAVERFGNSDDSAIRAMAEPSKYTLSVMEGKDLSKVKFVPPGRMYEVNLHADPDTFLHWDKPLSEQPEAVKQALQKVIGPGNYDEDRGLTLYNMIANSFDKRFFTGGHAEASQALRDAGISGIKYLDQGSRNVQIIPPEQNVHNQWLVKQVPNGNRLYLGPSEEEARKAYNSLSHNYVVFDPKLIEIVKKYGLAPLIAGGAMTLGGNADAAQHLIPVDYDPFDPDQSQGYPYPPDDYLEPPPAKKK